MKVFLIGILSFLAFFFVNTYFIGGLGGALLIGGDDFLNSYFAPIMTGLSAGVAIVITCTYIIVKKLNEISEKLNDSKE